MIIAKKKTVLVRHWILNILDRCNLHVSIHVNLAEAK